MFKFNPLNSTTTQKLLSNPRGGILALEGLKKNFHNFARFIKKCKNC